QGKIDRWPHGASSRPCAATSEPRRARAAGQNLATSAAGAPSLATNPVVMFRPYLLRDKVVLITGASRGLGLVLARELASAGARIVLASRDAWELQRAHDELASRGADLLAFPCDVADERQVDELARAAVDWFGRIDVLVNNAGVIHVGPWAAMHDEDFSRAFATHFWGPLWLMRAVVPEMRRQGGGSIVNISSIGGVVGLPHLAPYCPSKVA